MLKLFKIFLVLLVVSPTQVVAQNMNPEMCERLFSNGMAKFNVLSDTTKYDTFHDNFCNAHFEDYGSFQSGSAGFGINIPLTKGILGLTGSEENNSGNFKKVSDQFCHETDKQSYFRERFSSSSTQVTNELNTSFAKCMDTYKETYLQHHGVLLIVEPYPDLTRLRAAVYVNNQGVIKQPTVNAISPYGMKCMYGNDLIVPGVTKITQAQSLLDCEKNQDQSINMALEVENFPVSNSVNVPGYASTLEGLNEQVKVLQQQVSGFQTKLNEVGGKPSLVTDADGEGCEILGDRQLCWGSKSVSISGKGESRVNFKFQKPFRQGSIPIVTPSVSNQSASTTPTGYTVFGVTAYQATTEQIDFTTFQNSPNQDLSPGTVSVSYIAIGFPESPRQQTQ